MTRPQPREAMLRALLDELDAIVTPGDLTVLIATGTHRGNTPAELGEMLGAELAARLRVINHDARDESMLTWCGVHGDGVPVWLNRHWADADVKITTGFVEPHFFAGFSGGPKLVAPGLAGLETTLTLHDARRIGSDQATWAVCEGNPVHDDVRAIAAATRWTSPSTWSSTASRRWWRRSAARCWPCTPQPWVWINDREAAARATEYLLSLGHRTVHYISIPSSTGISPLLTGWTGALTAAGVEVPEPMQADWNPRSGYEAGRVLALDPSVTAVLCGNDDLALG